MHFLQQKFSCTIDMSMSLKAISYILLAFAAGCNSFDDGYIDLINAKKSRWTKMACAGSTQAT
jgi:hypothetical protein